ncbi:MAG: triose-phosphate isomerase [Alphaproteobacteria bacterium]|nr:triose-phosphate isomerase [Alphaproteobacteria bacterium]
MVVQGELFVIGNWKMHLTQQAATDLASTISDPKTSHDAVTIGIAPSFVALAAAKASRKSDDILIGGQDCYPVDEGAYTGSVSAAMLRDAGCSFVICGHSERRTHQQETSHFVREKAESAIKAGLHVILCVGENAGFREHGSYLSFVETQLRESLPASATRENLTVAYEPIWAIGTGKHASRTDIEEMHDHLKAVLHELLGEKIPRIIYGGSVKPNNALEIMSLPVVDGVLVGGASLDAAAFNAILDAAYQITSNQTRDDGRSKAAQ